MSNGYITYSEINRRWQEELAKGNNLSIPDIRNMIESERVTTQNTQPIPADRPTQVQGGGGWFDAIKPDFTGVQKDPEVMDSFWDAVCGSIW